MKLNDLRPNKGATKKRKRVGRGISAGQGKTAGRGTKGQGARKGGGKGAYFEGGQLPLVRRLPFKRGFSNIFRTPYQEVNVDQLEERFEPGAEVTPEAMAAARLIDKADGPVVVLGRGAVSKALTVKAHRFTKGAREKIEGAGGKAEQLELEFTGARATVKPLRKEQIAEMRARREQQVPE
jgi:large subunit ribosomal protein L15